MIKQEQVKAWFGGDAAKQRAETKAKAMRDAWLFAGVCSIDEVEKTAPIYVPGTNVLASHVVYGLSKPKF